MCLLSIIRRRLSCGQETAAAAFQPSFAVHGDWMTAVDERRIYISDLTTSGERTTPIIIY